VIPKAPRDDSALCRSCALCCDGTLFDNVRLGEDDLAAARRLRLPLLVRGSQTSFTQPCPHSRDRSCGIYDERPGACRTFVCITLAAYLAGELDRPAADARVERLRVAAAGIASQLPADTVRKRGIWGAITRFTEEGERAADIAAWRTRHGMLLLDILELERLRRRDFAASTG